MTACEIVLMVVCLVECVMMAVIAILGHVPAEGTFTIDETDPEDVKMSIALSDGFEKHKRVIIDVKHKDSRDKK